MDNYNYEDVLAIISDISPLDTLYFTKMHEEAKCPEIGGYNGGLACLRFGMFKSIATGIARTVMFTIAFLTIIYICVCAAVYFDNVVVGLLTLAVIVGGINGAITYHNTENP